MTDIGTYALAINVGVLLGGFAYGAGSDLKDREVADELWQVMGVTGFLVGFAPVIPNGTVPTVLWAVVGLLAIQHLFAWDTRIGGWVERYADILELAAYVVVVVIVGIAIVRVGVGPTAVPISVIAVLVTILLARGLFEAGILFGGADAKALMVAGLLVPVLATPLLPPPAVVGALDAVLPFSLNVLINSALCSVVIPIAIAIRNLRAGEFHGISGFIGYTIPVDDLPKKYVWLRDPMFGEAREEEKAIETSEDDRQRRTTIANELRSQGVQRVWVTPQIPFVAVMAVGVVAALIVGNVLFDLLFLL